GFSLLELMVVLVILGLLLMIALPDYQRSVHAGGRAEGQSLLLQVAADQERFYADNNTYSLSADPRQATATLVSESGLYEVKVATCPSGTIAECFVVTATPVGKQAADDCGALTLSSSGLKSATGGSAENCWR
ncbi:MAG: type IV pilin protein, partial [Pseudomonas sp.]